MTTILERARENADRMIDQARSVRQAGNATPIQSLTSGHSFGSAFASESNQGAKVRYDRNTSWTYASIRPIATRIAGQPLLIAKAAMPNSSRAVKSSIVPSYARQGLRKSLHAMPMADIEIIESHPLLDAINDPNGLMTCYSLLFTLTASLQLTGRAFWWMTKGAGERKGKVDIWPVPTHWVTANHSAGFRSAWKIKPPGVMDGFSVPGEAMAAFCYPDPSDPFGSYAPVEAAARDILTDESIKEAQHRGFDNDVIPGLAFILGDTAIGPDGKPTRPQAEPHQIEQLEQRLNQLYRGTSKSRRFILLDRLIKDVKQISTNPSEMDFQNSGKMVKSAIMQIFGVNPIIAGEVEGANRASATVAQDIVDDNVINPTIAMITQTINKSVVPIFSQEGENIVAWIKEASAIDPAERRASWELGQRMRAVTRDEYRAEVLGLPPLPNDEGNSLVMGISEIIEPVGEGLPEPVVDEPEDDSDDNTDDDPRLFRSNGNGQHAEKSRWNPALGEVDLSVNDDVIAAELLSSGGR